MGGTVTGTRSSFDSTDRCVGKNSSELNVVRFLVHRLERFQEFHLKTQRQKSHGGQTHRQTLTRKMHLRGRDNLHKRGGEGGGVGWGWRRGSDAVKMVATENVSGVFPRTFPVSGHTQPVVQTKLLFGRLASFFGNALENSPSLQSHLRAPRQCFLEIFRETLAIETRGAREKLQLSLLRLHGR